MTMAIGFKCHDGIVLCTDSMESDGYTKRNVDKIDAMLYITPHNWGVAFTGAGAILDKFFKDAIKEIQKSEGRYDLQEIEHAIERTLVVYRKRFRGNAFRILVGVFNRNRLESFLYRNDEAALVPVHDHTQVGVGASLSEFLAANVYDEDMNCAECAALGAFILKIAEQHVDGVGGPTRIVMYEKGDGLWRHPKRAEIAQMQKNIPLSEFQGLLRGYWRSRQKFRRWNDPLLPSHTPESKP